MYSISRLRFLPFAGCLLLAFQGCERRETPAEAGIRTQTLLVGNAAEPADLDPHVVSAFTDSNIVYTRFEALRKLDANASLARPGAADRWDVSPDGLVYPFHIRPNALWAAGDPPTADDSVYSF